MNQIQSFAVILCCVAYASAGFSSETQIDLELSEIYTSNIALQPSDQAVSDFVTRVSPSLVFSQESQIVDVDVDYTFEALIYAKNSTFNQAYHQLDSSALVRLIGDELVISGQAVVTQVNVDPLQQLQTSNVSVTGNRASGFYWDVGPQWSRQLPLNSEIEVSYLYGSISYDDESIQNVGTQRGKLRLATDPTAGSSTSYTIEYNYWFFDYETSGDIRDQNVYFSLSQEIGYGLDLVGLVGLDSDFTNLQDSTLSELRWEAGFESSGVNGHMRAMIGERYFGRVFRFSAGRSLADWYFAASYVEEPGTAESVFLQQGSSEVPKGEEGTDTQTETQRQAPINPPGIDEPGSAARFIRKRADLTVQMQGARSGTSFVAWWDQRNDLIRLDDSGINPPGDTESFGAVVGYDWRLGAKTAMNVTGSWMRRSFSELRPGTGEQAVFNEIDNWRASTDLSYELGRKTLVGSTLSYIDSSGQAIADNYNEIQFSVRVNRAF